MKSEDAKTQNVEYPSVQEMNDDQRIGIVKDIFASVTDKYDFLNRVLSGRRDVAWRKRTVSEMNFFKTNRFLDVATGTGRTLQQIRAAVPHAQLIGTDLSESYLRQANRWLNDGDASLVQLIRANGESLPLADESVQAVTSVFLLHELPGDAAKMC